jgi:hypothetical protein
MAEKDVEQRYTANLQGEVDGAALYRTLSHTERNPAIAQVYARLGAVEEAHAEFWKRKLGAIGRRVPKLRPSFRTRALSWLARHFGPAFVLPTINTLEQMDSGAYDAQPRSRADCPPPSDRMPASSKRWRRRHRPRSAARRSRGWRAGIAPWAATRCVPRCSAPMTDSAPI